MKVLWITNILFPDVANHLNLPVGFGGGWMLSTASQLKRIDSLDLAIATVSNATNRLITYSKDGICYFVLPIQGDNTKYHSSLERYWKDVYSQFQPDITHIHGTEFAHGLAYINACGTKNVVVSIQGMVSVIAKYYKAGITDRQIWKSLTFRDIVRMDSIWQQKAKFVRRGEIEKQIIKSVSHIIGRTSWDKSHAKALNPKTEYHFCGELLRESFYRNEWRYDRCTPHTIFISQAGYPIKGLHKVLEAMPLVLQNYPDAQICIAGEDIVSKSWFRISGYGRYIKHLIDKFDLSEKVSFLGALNELEMCRQYLKSNVFICPSAIENSPNSLGEAMALKMPYLAAYVGGVPDMVANNMVALYRFEEIEMLAFKICDIFSKKDKASTSIDNQYDCNHIEQILNIYNNIV